jgi:Skp family chaperone for outer membrane proteins
MFQQRITHIGVLGLALLIGAGALTVRAGENQPAAPSIAVVDMNRVFQASDAPKQLDQKAAEIESAAVKKMQDIAAGAFLTQPEGKEYLQLLAKAMPLPAEEARIKELRELSESRSKRMLELSGKNPLNDMEKKEMTDLNARQRQMEIILPRLQEDLQGDVAARIEAFRRELFSQLRGVVGQVAKDKGVTQVFSSEALVYSTNDLTPQVVQKVKK